MVKVNGPGVALATAAGALASGAGLADGGTEAVAEAGVLPPGVPVGPALQATVSAATRTARLARIAPGSAGNLPIAMSSIRYEVTDMFMRPAAGSRHGGCGGVRSALSATAPRAQHRSMTTATTLTDSAPADDARRRALVERATVREVLMGAQDNLTNVLAVVLGVTIGAGRVELVALAGTAAAVAEAISMGGVLYTSTQAERDLDARTGHGPLDVTGRRLGPATAAVVTGVAALIGGLLPLAPFMVLPLGQAVMVSLLISVTALFALGSATASVTHRTWWRDGIRMVLIAGSAALAAAAIGALLRVD